MPKYNQPTSNRVSKQNQESSQRTVLPNSSVKLQHISQEAINAILPPGIQFDYAGTVVPAGFLPCDGTIVTREDYPNLFANIGTTWNTGGETSLQFRLPDSRGKIAVGHGATAGVTFNRPVGPDTLNTGQEVHQLTVNEMPGHNHGGTTTGATGAHSHTSNTNYFLTQTGGPGLIAPGAIFGAQANTSSDGAHQHTVDSQGSNQFHNNMQPFGLFKKIIKY